MFGIKSKKKEEIKPPPIGKEVKTSRIPDNCIAIFFILGLSAIISILMYPNILTKPKKYHVGDIADRNIKAAFDFLVENKELTEKTKEKAARAVCDVYDFDPTASHLIERIKEAFKAAREKIRKKEDLEEIKKDFFEILLISPDDNVFYEVFRANFSKEIENRLIQIISPIIKRGIFSDKRAIIPSLKKGIVIHNIITGSEIKVKELEGFYDLKEAKKEILEKSAILEKEDRELADTVKKLAFLLIHPNITFNSRETELRREIAKRSVKPFYFKVKKGEMIVREGERITKQELIKLNAQYRLIKKTKGIRKVSAIFVLISSLMGTVYIVGKEYRRKMKDLVFISLLLLFIFSMLVFMNFSAEEIAKALQRFSPHALLFSIPVASGPMLVSIFFGLNYAIGISFIIATISAMALGGKIEYFIYFFVSSLISAYGVRNCRERIVFIKTGLKVGAAGIVLAISAEVIFGFKNSMEIAVAVLSAFTGGLLTGVITAGLQPVVETVFGYTSDIKLLELASLDQPLLQELMVRAPGTYHHSVVVSNMVEAAAHEIGANPLLAKVAAYYHDIGKMKKPLYFVENQMGSENKHEKLSPYMSALIIISHVKDGVEIAKKYGLGQEIIDIIQQHHGTSLVSYFYEKAKQQAERSEKQTVREEDFRYPGPKPQTKEAGLVMLADAVEAACRSLSDPTPARIKGTVQSLSLIHI